MSCSFLKHHIHHHYTVFGFPFQYHIRTLRAPKPDKRLPKTANFTLVNIQMHYPRKHLVTLAHLVCMWDMVLNHSTLEHIGRSESKLTLRLYEQSPTYLSLGYAQPF